MNWEKFLQSLETRGGKVMILLALVVFIFIVCVVLIVTGHPPREAGRQLMGSIVSAALGAMYGYMEGHAVAVRQNGPKMILPKPPREKLAVPEKLDVPGEKPEALDVPEPPEAKPEEPKETPEKKKRKKKYEGYGP